jgi:dUTP pyrophosphatase
VPDGHFLAVIARSSTPLRRGLIVANAVGVIDPDYCGPVDEVKIQVLNITTDTVRVQRGDRIAQGLVLAAPRIEWEEVTEVSAASRGGFGSTGQ